jgi:hypothetical protein
LSYIYFVALITYKLYALCIILFVGLFILMFYSKYGCVVLHVTIIYFVLEFLNIFSFLKQFNASNRSVNFLMEEILTILD